jgi:hypothetical protein
LEILHLRKTMDLEPAKPFYFLIEQDDYKTIDLDKLE